MVQSIRENVHRVADPENLDASVEEVFRMMLGVSCTRDAEFMTAEEGPESLTAVVGFGGLLSGACVVRAGSFSARKVASLLTGMEIGGLDDTVMDAMGEICNMLAGAWKGRVPELAAHCGLSVPAVITGSSYHLHVQALEFQLRHSYRFEDAAFTVTIVCDGLK